VVGRADAFPPFARLALAARCGASMRLESLATDDTADPIRWADERIGQLYAAGAGGSLYVFIRDPLDPTLAEMLRHTATGTRPLHPQIIAPGSAFGSRRHLELLKHAGVRRLYLTLCGATAARHDAAVGEAGSWRRVLLLLTTAPRVIERLPVGVHVALSRDTVRELPGIFRVLAKLGGAELLLWHATDEPDGDSSAALGALDFAVSTAAKVGVRIFPVGFESTRTATAPRTTAACVASGAIIDLLRDGIPLPSTAGGLYATTGSVTPIAEIFSSAQALRQVGFELAAGHRPLLDLPACLGGPPPADSAVPPDGVKVDACRACPVDRACAGVPASTMDVPGLREQLAPPRHWLGMKEHARVLVMCGPVSDIYGTTFFSLARWLARFGARVDVVTPWAVHEDIASGGTEVQPAGRPEGVSEFERFMLEGPIERYDLIGTPDPKVTRPLVVGRSLPSGARLVVTDFHMLGGMDEWVRDLCAPGRRAEEGGWWPSQEIVLHSGFPGFASLYTRYGIPMPQVA